MRKPTKNTKAMIESMKVERNGLLEEAQRISERIRGLESLLVQYGVKDMRLKRRHLRVKETDPSATHRAALAAVLRSVTREYAGLKQSEAAYRFLKETRRPAHISDVAEALFERGIELRGGTQGLSKEEVLKRFRQSLVTALLRDRRFRNEGKNRYTLVEEDGVSNTKPLLTERKTKIMPSQIEEPVEEEEFFEPEEVS